MNPQKEFKIACFTLLFLGVLDILSILVGYFENGKLTAGLTVAESVVVFLFLGINVLIMLAKIYMGVAGLKYCNGTGKGKLHITLAKIGLVFCVIVAVTSLIDIVTGAAAVETIFGEITSITVMYWYLTLAQKNYT